MNNVMLLAKTTGDLGGAFSPERVTYALEMTVLGIVAVFAVLAILWGVLALFKVFMYDIPQKKAKAKTKLKEEPVVVTEPIAPAPVVAQNNDETVAVIVAAISAYIAADPALAEEYAGGFRVVSFKRVRDKAAWNKK